MKIQRYKKMVVKFLSVAFLSILLVSCGKHVSLEGRPDNIYGGADRSNSYEEYGSLISYNVFTDLPKISGDSSGSAIPPLPLSESQIVVANVSGLIVLIENNSVLWIAKLDSNSTTAAAMCADPNQNIYVVSTDGKLYSLTSGGKMRWKVGVVDSMPKMLVFTDLLAQSDGIVAGTGNGELVKFSFSGKVMWRNKFNLSLTNLFAGDDKNNLAIALTNDDFGATDTLVYMNKDGKKLWQKGYSYLRILRSPVFTKNKIIIAGVHYENETRTNYVIALDSNGNTKWQYELPYTPRFISADKDGRVYIAGYNAGIGEALSGIFCLSNDGKFVWKQYFNVAIPSPLMIGEKNLAFVGTAKGTTGIYYLNKEGELTRSISMSNNHLLYLQPVVKPDAAIVFSIAERLGIIRIDENFLDKILPF